MAIMAITTSNSIKVKAGLRARLQSGAAGGKELEPLAINSSLLSEAYTQSVGRCKEKLSPSHRVAASTCGRVSSRTMRKGARLKPSVSGDSIRKRQRAGAVQNLSEFLPCWYYAKRLGLRQPSGAFISGWTPDTFN